MMKRKLGIVSSAIIAALIGNAAADDSKGYISKWGAAPTFKGDGWEFKIGGRVQLDYSIVDADVSGADWSAGELRRFRLGVSGKFGDNLKYKAEFNTNSSGNINLEDGYVQWAPTSSGWDIKLGQYKTPNSLDEQTSSRFISTLERAAFTDAFEFNRRLGVSLNAKGDSYTFSAGIFSDNLNTSSQQEGYALAARGTFNPVKSEDLLVHLGASVRYRNIGDTQSDLRYRQRPVSHIPSRIISTGRITESDAFIGAEAAVIVKNFWAAGEYGVTIAECTPAAGCTNDPALDGAYGEVGVIFGGKRGYKGGKFDRPKVDHPVSAGGMGALAFVARFDTINLTDAGINGGSFNSYTIGVDWWETKYTRLGVNYFKLDANLGNSTSGLDAAFATLVSASAPSQNVQGVMFRAQFDF